ncbi:MAG: Hpt domain-containing protein, partial [Planctomycetota bacterium]
MTDLTSPHDPLPGGISRHDIAQMLDDGQNVAPELQEIFGEEAEEHLRTIYDGLDRLRVDGDDREALGNVRRASHTLKGAAGAVGVRAVTRLAHRMEDLLDILFDEQKTVTSEITILLLSTADRMQELTGENPNTASMVKAIADLFVEYAKHLSSENDTTASESGAAASAETTDSSADSDELDPSVAAELAALGFAEGDLGF